MIQFNNLNPEIPYQLLKEKYDEALNAGQQHRGYFDFFF